MSLEEYAGAYALGPGVDLMTTVEPGRLLAQITGQPRVELFAESESRFFLKAVNAPVDFVEGSEGAVAHLVVHQGGRGVKAVRR